MIDYSINIYSLLMLVVLLVSSSFALGSWVRKTETSQGSGASKGDLETIRTSMSAITHAQQSSASMFTTHINELQRRVTAVESRMVDQRELGQITARLSALERLLESRLNDR